MAQLAKIIDIDRSFIPVDPNAFPETYHATDKEDYPEKRVPVVPFYGWNFLPTANGYKSYFGINQTLEIAALTSRCDDCFIIQTETFNNILVALCEDGIWTKNGDAVGSWDHVVSLTVPPTGEHLNWTHCVIGNKVYAYRATEASYYEFNNQITTAAQPAASGELSSISIIPFTGAVPAGTYTYKLARRLISTGALTLPSTGISIVPTEDSLILLDIPIVTDTDFYRVYRTLGSTTYYKDVIDAGTFQDDNTGWTVIVLPDTSYPILSAFTPTTVTPIFLNMAGQHGIFKAGIRLGFWDSENSVSWSSIDDFSDFTPSIETLAGSAIFSDVAGRITTITDQEEGFIIYSTKSIVHVAQVISETFQWNPRVLLDSAGVSFQKQVTKGSSINQQFAWTSSGLAKIESGTLQIIVPEITDYLLKTEDPIFLSLLNNRYLCLHILNTEYINAQVRFDYEQVNDLSYHFPEVAGISELYPDQTFSSNLDFCLKSSLLSGEGSTIDQQADAQAAWEAANAVDPENFPPPISQNVRNVYEAVWSGELQVQDVPDPNSMSWTNSPVQTLDAHSVERNMCPSAPYLRNDTYGIGTGNVAVLSNKEGFTLKQLIQIQTALWDWEDSKRSAFINKILNRTFLDYINDSIPAGVDEQEIGTFISGNSWHDNGWAANKCSFWMSRSITKGTKIIRRRVAYNAVSEGSVLVWSNQNLLVHEPGYTGGDYQPPEGASLNSVGLQMFANYLANNPSRVGYDYYFGYTTSLITGNSYAFRALAKTYGFEGLPASSFSYGTYKDTIVTGNSVVIGTNKGEAATVDVTSMAFFKLVGWKYKDVNGIYRIVDSIPDPDCHAPDDPDFTGSFIVSGDQTPNSSNGSMCGEPFPDITIPGYSISPLTWPAQSLTIPGGSFLLQKGSIGPIYPTFPGALVYDLFLKKWGKIKQNYRLLVDYSPINTQNDAIISTDDFKIQGGLLTSDGYLKLFDEFPTNSVLGWGKIGLYRLGMTAIEEVTIHNTLAKNFTVKTHTSLNAITAETALTTQTDFVDTIKGVVYPNVSGRWHIVEVSGNYDIKYLEILNTVAGRR